MKSSTLYMIMILLVCESQYVHPEVSVLTTIQADFQKGEELLNHTISKLMTHIEQVHDYTSEVIKSVISHGNMVLENTRGPVMTALEDLVTDTKNWIGQAKDIGVNILPCTAGQLEVARQNTDKILNEVQACIEEATQPAKLLSRDISDLRQEARDLLNSGLSDIRSCVPSEFPTLGKLLPMLRCMASSLKTVNYETLRIYSSIASDRLKQLPHAFSVPVSAAKCSASGTSQAATDIGRISENIHLCVTRSLTPDDTDT